MTKFSKKILSMLVAICVLASLFTCLNLSVMTASAITATKMIHVDSGNNKYISYLWRPAEYDDMIKPNTDYRLTFYWENINNADLSTKWMFYALYFKESESAWKGLFGLHDLTYGGATEKSLETTDLAHGQLVTLDFTTPEDCRDGGSIAFCFGDWNWASRNVVFNLAEIKLYTRSGDSLTEVPMTDITANETLGTCTTDAPTDDLGVILRNTTKGDGSEISFLDIPSGYFASLTGCTHESKSLVEAEDSTCTTHGHDDYYVCDNCGAIFDSDDNEISLADVEWELDPDIHETEIPVPEVPSTCKTPGHTAYIACSGCGAILSGSNDELPLDPNNHAGEGTELRDVVKATDHSTGYSGDTYCLGCGAKLAEGEETPVIIRKMYHFPAFDNNWQVLVFKMSGTFPAGNCLRQAYTVLQLTKRR